jgi:hypothetical protein
LVGEVGEVGEVSDFLSLLFFPPTRVRARAGAAFLIGQKVQMRQVFNRDRKSLTLLTALTGGTPMQQKNF